MVYPNFRILLVGSALLVGACSFGDDNFPTLTAPNPAGNSTTAQKGSTQTAQNTQQRPANAGTGAAARASSQPALGTGNFVPGGVTPGQSTGTFVGKKVEELREELRKLQTSVRTHNGQLQELRGRVVGNSQQYHGTVAAVQSRLQVGTTRGNPVLVQQFNTAQQDLNRIAQDIGEMNKLGTGIASDSTVSSFLTESVRAAFEVSGAVDEDHRQLAILEDEVDRTVVLIDRLNREVTEDVRRQTTWVQTERSNLGLLSAGIRSGESLGASLLNRAIASGNRGGVAVAGAPVPTTGRRPLVVIRFDRPNVPFQQALYTAVSQVLEQRPAAVFDLVAVAPQAGGTARVAINSNKAKRHADSVKRSLLELGLPAERLAVSSTTLPSARSNEVHLYIR